MHIAPSLPGSTPSPHPQHPLADNLRRGIPVTVIVLVGWLAWLGRTTDQIAALLALLATGFAAYAAPAPDGA